MATCNGAATLPKVLAAYGALQSPPGGWRLLVADDGSTDATAALLAAHAARLPLQLVRLARGGKNRALNTLLELALVEPASTLFVFTDDDATPEPDWLVELAACAAAQPGCALFGGAITADWGATPPDWIARVVPLGLTYAVTAVADGPVFPGLVWGANMAVRRAVFEAGHRFDAAVGPRAGAYAMGSETEFNRRLGAAGHLAWFCNAARVGHFIRPHQLTVRYILARAYRFGRGARAQDPGDGTPQLFGAPRWRLARLLQAALGAVGAWLARERDTLFRHRWDWHMQRGYLFQAWFARGPRRPRVLITSCSGALGGMELRMAQEARLLEAEGWRSIVATPRFAGYDKWMGALRADGIETSVFDPPQFLEQWPWRRTRQLGARVMGAWGMRALRPDLVHIAFCWTSYGASLLWLASHCKLPAVISVHNAFPLTTLAPWQVPRYAAAFQSVRGVYAVSDSALRHFMANFGALLPAAARTCVIPNCVDPTRFVPSAARRAATRARLGIDADALVIGCVARLAPQKRPHALLEMASLLRARFPGLKLVFAGSGPLERELRERAIGLGLEGQVVFAGFVDAVEDMLPAFDLHVLLSRNEGFGIATIEAMACGVPALGTDVPGTADILRGSAGGLLLPSDDAAAASALVASLLADPARRARMGAAARAEVEVAYTPAIMARRVHAFYAGLPP
jgi:glycosyltransferase involved in cell wall biosynthesis